MTTMTRSDSRQSSDEEGLEQDARWKKHAYMYHHVRLIHTVDVIEIALDPRNETLLLRNACARECNALVCEASAGRLRFLVVELGYPSLLEGLDLSLVGSGAE